MLQSEVNSYFTVFPVWVPSMMQHEQHLKRGKRQPSFDPPNKFQHAICGARFFGALPTMGLNALIIQESHFNVEKYPF